MATTMHNQLGPLTKNQFAALPPHLKLQNSENLVQELHLNAGSALQRLGATGVPPQNGVQPLHANVPTVAASLPKRPLNSWMAYRSYYTRIFANLQQKDASRHLTKLWNEDPFKAKWAIIARAYSKIRSLVGTYRAPLEGFFGIACPAIGIISVDEYLTKMNWSFEIAEGGVFTLHQTSPPLSTGFEHHIMHTSMNDNDVILWAGACQYIPMSIASRLAFITTPIQQNVIAAAPVFRRPAPLQPAPPSAPFLQADPISAATTIFGFDVNDLLNSHRYEWTGSMSDLYNPDAGYIDIESITNNEASSEWEVSNIQDPQDFESLFEGVIESGYITPNVQDREGRLFSATGQL